MGAQTQLNVFFRHMEPAVANELLNAAFPEFVHNYNNHEAEWESLDTDDKLNTLLAFITQDGPEGEFFRDVMRVQSDIDDKGWFVTVVKAIFAEAMAKDRAEIISQMRREMEASTEARGEELRFTPDSV
jgi:hypothetical protein